MSATPVVLLFVLLVGVLGDKDDVPAEGNEYCQLDAKQAGRMNCDCDNKFLTLRFQVIYWKNLHIRNCMSVYFLVNAKPGQSEMEALELEDVDYFQIIDRSLKTAFQINRMVVRNFVRVTLLWHSLNNVTVDDCKIENGQELRLYSTSTDFAVFGELKLTNISIVNPEASGHPPLPRINVLRNMEMFKVNVKAIYRYENVRAQFLFVANGEQATFSMKQGEIDGTPRKRNWTDPDFQRLPVGDVNVQGFKEVAFEDCQFKSGSGDPSLSLNFTNDFKVTFDQCTFQNLSRDSLQGAGVREVTFVNNKIENMDPLPDEVDIKEDDKKEVDRKYFGNLFDAEQSEDFKGNQWDGKEITLRPRNF